MHRADGVGGRVDGDLDRVLEVVPDQVADVAVERRREEHRLRPGRAVAQDPLDLRREAVVGHPVGLVEDDDVDVGQRDLVRLQQVDEAQRRRHDDLHARRAARRSAGAGWPRRRRRGCAGRRRWRPARGPRRPARPARGSARGRGPSGRAGSARSTIRESIGTPNASVLPDPVRARPQTSRPSMATGIASVWILNGWAKPGRGEPVVDARRHAELGESGRRFDRRQDGDRRQCRGAGDVDGTVGGGRSARPAPAAGGSPPRCRFCHGGGQGTRATRSAGWDAHVRAARQGRRGISLTARPRTRRITMQCCAGAPGAPRVREQGDTLSSTLARTGSACDS